MIRIETLVSDKIFQGIAGFEGKLSLHPLWMGRIQEEHELTRPHCLDTSYLLDSNRTVSLGGNDVFVFISKMDERWAALNGGQTPYRVQLDI